MERVCLFCKSYLPDLERLEALVETVRRFNDDGLNFFVSVPQSDLAVFRSRLGSEAIEWLTDEDIVHHSSPYAARRLAEMPGMLSQQVVKAEFWRTGLSENYLCLDSDCLLIRPFHASDFLAADGTPYSVLHEGKASRQFFATHGLSGVVQNLDAEKQVGLELLGRSGLIYNFGPFPVIWSARVWKALADNFLSVKGWSMFDAIQFHPHEATWYGEALLNYGAIPVYPREPLFKAYLYLEEYEADRQVGITTEILARDYLGVVYQSNWYPKRLGIGKNLAYKAKKMIRKFRGVD
jgi:hypothetical protein